MLEQSRDYVSGQDICDSLSLSRTAVWKHINTLRAEGYEIASVNNRGYKLNGMPDIINEKCIKDHLHTKWLGQNVIYYEETDSSNNKAKQLGEEGEKEKQEYKRVKEIAVAAGVALPGEEGEKDTRTEATIDLIARLDRELTSIQKQISADLKHLEDLRMAREAASHREKKRQLELELLDARIEQVDAQTNKLLGTDLEIEDTSEIDALIYGGEDDADNAQDSPVSADAEGSEASEDD